MLLITIYCRLSLILMYIYGLCPHSTLTESFGFFCLWSNKCDVSYELNCIILVLLLLLLLLVAVMVTTRFYRRYRTGWGASFLCARFRSSSICLISSHFSSDGQPHTPFAQYTHAKLFFFFWFIRVALLNEFEQQFSRAHSLTRSLAH